MPILKQLKQHKLLLDTHVWIWLLTGNEDLSASFRKTIERTQEAEMILISPMSIWELGMLGEKKRINIDMDPLDWVNMALSDPIFTLAHMNPRIAIQSSRLPGEFHGDPADRILVATAFEYNAVLVTHDQKILDYGKGKFIAVNDPC